MTKYHRIPLAEIRRLWLDDSLTGPEVADRLGMSERVLRFRVKAMDLPARRLGPRRKVQGTLLDEMWLGGVRVPDIVAHLNVSRSTVENEVRLRGLPARPKAWGGLISAAEYLYAKRLSDSAKETRGAMLNAEMVDRRGGNPSGKARAI